MDDLRPKAAKCGQTRPLLPKRIRLLAAAPPRPFRGRAAVCKRTDVKQQKSEQGEGDTERRLLIDLKKMTQRQDDLVLSIRFDKTSYKERAARHGITINQVTNNLAFALRIWSRYLHARIPFLV